MKVSGFLLITLVYRTVLTGRVILQELILTVLTYTRGPPRMME